MLVKHADDAKREFTYPSSDVQDWRSRDGVSFQDTIRGHVRLPFIPSAELEYFKTSDSIKMLYSTAYNDELCSTTQVAGISNELQ